MTITLPEDLAAEVARRAAEVRRQPEELVLSALEAHFAPVDSELLEEMRAWERAAEEDAAAFNREHGL